MTSIWTFFGGHGGYLAVALFTHALVGYVLGARLFDEPWAGVIGGLLADVDLLFPVSWGAPFVHRGLTHAPVSGGVAVAVASRVSPAVAGAIGVGYASQLLIDATTPKGIMLAYPLSTESVAVSIGGHSPPLTLVLWIVCFTVLWRRRSTDAAGRGEQEPKATE